MVEPVASKSGSNFDLFLARLAARPLPSLAGNLLASALVTAIFVAIRMGLERILVHQVGFSLLLPAVLLASVAGGWLGAVVTMLLCIFSTIAITQLLQPASPPLEILGQATLSFIIVGTICGVVGTSLRKTLHNLHIARENLNETLQKHELASTQLSAMIDQVSSGILRTDIEGTVLEANAQFARMIDRPLDQIIGHNVIEFTHPDDIAITRQRLDNYKFPGRTDWQFEKRYLRPDGSIVQVLLDVRSLRGDLHHSYGLICIVVDVTAARQAEDALQESRQNFFSVADAVSIMIWMTDNEMRGRFVNRAYLEFVNKEVSEVEFSDWQKHLHPDDYEHIVAQFQAGLKSGERFDLLARYRRHDGQWRWLRSVHQPRYNRDGSKKGLLTTAFDVTDEHEAAARVQESEARFRTIADSAPAIIWMIDAQGYTQFGNRRFRSMFSGKPPKRLLSTVRELIHPEDLADFDKTLHDATRYERRFSHLGRINHPVHGMRWLRTEGAPRYDPQGELQGFTGVSLDVTETQRAEQDLKRINELLEERVNAALSEKAAAEAELVRSHRLEAVGRLTGGVAHDFNNLLTVIMGGLEIIRKSEDPVRRQKMTDAALAAAKRGERLTGQLLAFSRRQTLRPSSVDLNALIREGEPLLHKAVGEGMSLTFKLKRGRAPTLVDSAKFEAALINLLVNARDASPSDALIQVQTADYYVTEEGAEGGTLPAIHPADLLPGRYVRVTVSDNGSGMTEDILKHVFEPFFTTKGIGHGTGLGLSQVYGFTRQSGGSISIQSEPGKGTQINMFLPWQPLSRTQEEADDICQPEEESDCIATQNTDSGDGIHTPPLRMLLVEDDPHVADVAATVLRSEGIDVDVRANAAEALNALKDKRYDVLLSDVLMPGGMSGIELAHRTSEEWPHMQIILSSGFPGEAEALRETPWAFLAKPYTPGQLRAVLGQTRDKSKA